MATLFLTSLPMVSDYRMEIEDPPPPYAAALLAASGLFDVIEIRGAESKSANIRLEGRTLLRSALFVWKALNRELEEAQRKA